MRMNRVTLILAAILIMLLPAARPAAAQDTGTVSGTVVDASGQVLPGATVTLVNEATGDARTTVTGDRGEITVRAVRPGTDTARGAPQGIQTIKQRSKG